MTRTTAILRKHSTSQPLHFWVATTKSGEQRAYYFAGRKQPLSLQEVLLAEAQGIAVRTEAPAF